MKPFGMLLIAVVIYLILKNKKVDIIYIKLITLTICIEAFVNLGYFFKINSFELQYAEFLLIILGFVSIYQLIIHKVNKNLLILVILLITSVLISNILLIIIPFQKPIISFGMSWNAYFSGNMILPTFTVQTIKMTIRIFLFALIVISSNKILTKDNINYVISIFLKFGLFIIFIGFVEFIIKNMFQSNVFGLFTSWFFGIGEWTLESLLERGNTYALQGFTREPAHFALSLFILGFVLICKTDMKKRTMYLLAILITMVLSRSFSAIIYIGTLYFVYTIVNKKYIAFSLIPILYIGFLVLNNYLGYYIDRLANIYSIFISSNINFNSSEYIRILSILENFKIFLNRPLFGIGVGTSYAHAFIPTFVASVGIIGFSLWFMLVFKGIAKLKFTYSNTIIILLLLFTWTFTGTIATAYSMTTLLIALSINISVINLNSREIKLGGS